MIHYFLKRIRKWVNNHQHAVPPRVEFLIKQNKIYYKPESCTKWTTWVDLYNSATYANVPITEVDVPVITVRVLQEQKCTCMIQPDSQESVKFQRYEPLSICKEIKRKRGKK